MNSKIKKICTYFWKMCSTIIRHLRILRSKQNPTTEYDIRLWFTYLTIYYKLIVDIFGKCFENWKFLWISLNSGQSHEPNNSPGGEGVNICGLKDIKSLWQQKFLLQPHLIIFEFPQAYKRQNSKLLHLKKKRLGLPFIVGFWKVWFFFVTLFGSCSSWCAGEIGLKFSFFLNQHKTESSRLC